MSEGDRFETCTKAGCGGLAVNRDTGSVYGGRIVYCLKCFEGRIAELEAALRWYANPNNWSDEVPGWFVCEEMCEAGRCTCNVWEPDYGEHARNALEPRPLSSSTEAKSTEK